MEDKRIQEKMDRYVEAFTDYIGGNIQNKHTTENNYDTWSREELLYEVKKLNSELEKVKQLKRLTDDRFVGDGFYQPKSKEERKEIQDMYKPSYKEIYDRLAEYERRFCNG